MPGEGEDPRRLAGERKRYMKAKLAHVAPRDRFTWCAPLAVAQEVRSAAGPPLFVASVPSVRLRSSDRVVKLSLVSLERRAPRIIDEDQ